MEGITLEGESPLSKRKQKKLLKRIGWHEKKMDLRAKEKEKYRAKRRDMKEKGIERKGKLYCKFV